MFWKIPITLGITGIALGITLYCYSQLLPGDQMNETLCQFAQEQDEELKPFPIVLEEQLVIESLGGYEGPFLEDGTYEEVCDVVAVQVRNQGNKPISSTELFVKTCLGVYQFKGTLIMPGQTCVLLELSRLPYKGETSAMCTGTLMFEDRQNLLHTAIKLKEGSDDTLIITNETDKRQDGVCLYYKMYLEPTDILVGGITYQMQLKHLLPGEKQILRLPHYVQGYSRILAAYKATLPAKAGSG